MTDNLDFSQLAHEEDSLISWEELFPEYAIGGETFKSGQTTQKPLKPKPQEQNKTIQLSESLPNPVSEEKPNQTAIQQSAKESSIQSDSIEILSMPELPDIPSLMDDFITVSPEEQNKEAPSSISVPQQQKTFTPDWIDKALVESEQMISETSHTPKDQDFWANRFNQLNFPSMDLMAVSYFGSFTYDMLEQHILLKRVTRDFVRLLSYHYPMDLRSAGVSEEGIFYMKKGQIPENFTVHLKYPPEYGGTIDFNNMVFMQDKPFHDMIHSYLDEQLLTNNGISYPPLLYVPTPVGKIYIPFGIFTGSGGKNKQDRSVYAGFSKAAFEKIALKAMPGR